MKRMILFLVVSGITGISFSQSGTFYSSRGKGKEIVARMVKTPVGDEVIPGQQQSNPYVSGLKSVLTDPTIFQSYYDLQTNTSSGQQRIYQFPDGTLGGVGTMSLASTGTSWPDRGTGYNYYNGSSWGSMPSARVETSIRTGWPSYQPWGANGECILAHQFPTGNLILSTRPVKGSGAWTTKNNLTPPAGVPAMAWPRMVTNGTDHMNIHVIAVTEPTANGGTVYNGMDGCLLYNRSTDGGATWGTWTQLPGMTSSEYLNITADVYAWALPHGDTIAFITGDSWTDEFMMKSTDNGTTWTKTVIFSNPYNLTGYLGNNEWFYCPDGTSAVCLDSYGNAHVCFGLLQDSNAYYRPYTNGLIYWNETMAQLPQILDPDTLYNHGNLIAWQLDTTIFPPSSTSPNHLASYYTSLTSNPGILIDANNDIFIIWSGVTSYLDNSPAKYYLRHVFEKSGHVNSDGSFWFHSAFTDLCSDFIYQFMECVYPDISQSSYDDKLHILFQGDELAGSWVKGLNITGYAGQTSSTLNSFVVLNPDKPLWTGVKKENRSPSLSVSANYPNPFHATTSIAVNTPHPGNLTIEVFNMVGQKMIRVDFNYINAGSYNYTIDGSHLSPGVYFYTVKLDKESVAKKMVVE